MGLFTTIKFNAKTIDGVIQRTPQVFNLKCDDVVPVGRQNVRNYNGNECIAVVDVFLIYYRGQSLGTLDYNDADQFIAFLNNTCHSSICKQEFLLMNGCYALVKGCVLTL